MSGSQAPLAAGRAVAVEQVVKQFGATKALDGVSVEIDAGELFGFIGPDGAGKTTLFRILATLLVPTAGRAQVLGIDVVRGMWDLRKTIGYMPGRFSLYPDLSVEENLRFFASVFGTTIEREYQNIAPIYVQIEPFKDRRAAALSGGMKQKLALCCALVHRPRILFLDEPTTGVDAVSRREFWDLLGRLKTGGLTIVVSTPYMDEATRCDRVALIEKGRLLSVDTPARIVASYGRPLFDVHVHDRYRALLALRRFPHTFTIYPFGETLHYTDSRPTPQSDAIGREVEAFLRREGIDGARVQLATPTVEDSFMAMMGRPE